MTHEHEIKLSDSGLPTTFIPGRNTFFLTVATALAYRREINDIVGGMCETDYSGYPDCRDDTIKAMEVALSLAMDREFALHMPLMWLDKAGTWKLAEDLSGAALIDLIIEDTHTCYVGDRSERHEWGYGCGMCPACELRAKGYAAYRNES
jgi:7-cyano-7-deazaguanine synthase